MRTKILVAVLVVAVGRAVFLWWLEASSRPPASSAAGFPSKFADRRPETNA